MSSYQPDGDDLSSAYISDLNYIASASNSQTPICHCQVPSSLRTVRKQFLENGTTNPNLGRKFYGCNKLKKDGGCDFFLWEDGQPSQYSKEQMSQVMNKQASDRLARIETLLDKINNNVTELCNRKRGRPVSNNNSNSNRPPQKQATATTQHQQTPTSKSN
jgi:hypothetical protein